MITLHGKDGDLMVDVEFWRNKKVFVTGHTGFKGSWLCLWLHLMGAKVTGYSLKPPTNPSMFDLCRIDELVNSHYADVRNQEKLIHSMLESAPDIVIHMAAQPIVRASYQNPVETFEINVMGTVNVLEAVRIVSDAGVPIQAVLNITTDKCYQNFEWSWGYRENDRLGGFDPYSNSKACSELITDSYRHTFFSTKKDHGQKVALASARAGNVIGGGDWASDRLIPDCIRSVLNQNKMKIRFPKAVRPWQHVLEPLHGYLILLQRLANDGDKFAEAWNFGPNDEEVRTVQWVVEEFYKKWGRNATFEIDHHDDKPIEATFLKLDCSKAKQKLNWNPVWSLNTAIDKIVEWTRAFEDKRDLRKMSLNQIRDYIKDVNKYGH
ncbi:CDP-glucose 4,6-dehydratase [Oikeobacillus pervagus]|uniref:CDP-glucose 4,6-dehydratase n=1 Tax=Oikeobacillus pervagus TaxID=1325931 RepID=A0AAJ1T776_9BACI|nr:CDP-glucose 4,6-dehydratase [Oikeobacillus pervagus]MDQ0216411.1 CDP-glucose 4,6-dehydratase [Oikeobacillus pervagus]